MQKKYKNEKNKNKQTNKEWILITLKAATKRCFLKTATPKFRKCKQKKNKICVKFLKSIFEGTPLNGCFLTFSGLQIPCKVIVNIQANIQKMSFLEKLNMRNFSNFTCVHYIP